MVLGLRTAPLEGMHRLYVHVVFALSNYAENEVELRDGISTYIERGIHGHSDKSRICRKSSYLDSDLYFNTFGYCFCRVLFRWEVLLACSSSMQSGTDWIYLSKRDVFPPRNSSLFF